MRLQVPVDDARPRARPASLVLPVAHDHDIGIVAGGVEFVGIAHWETGQFDQPPQISVALVGVARSHEDRISHQPRRWRLRPAAAFAWIVRTDGLSAAGTLSTLIATGGGVYPSGGVVACM